MMTREEILWGYRYVLGRDPEGDGAYAAHQGHADRDAFRRALIQSPEGIRRLSREIYGGPPIDYFRPLTVFIHLEKTGGMSVHQALAARPGVVASLPQMSHLAAMTLGYLNRFDLISGHFTYQEALALPRTPKTLVTVLREPEARLISFYHFHRAHGEDGRANPLVALALDLRPADFFRHEQVVNSHRFFNAYVHCFAGLPAHPPHCSDEAMEAALDRALARLESVDIVGLTERMDAMTRLCRARFGDDMPVIGHDHRTDALPSVHTAFRAVESVEPDDELREVIEPLVRYHRRVYSRAVQLHDEALARFDIPQGAREAVSAA